jgi:hypothetical protein
MAQIKTPAIRLSLLERINAARQHASATVGKFVAEIRDADTGDVTHSYAIPYTGRLTEDTPEGMRRLLSSQKGKYLDYTTLAPVGEQGVEGETRRSEEEHAGPKDVVTADAVAVFYGVSVATPPPAKAATRSRKGGVKVSRPVADPTTNGHATKN